MQRRTLALVLGLLLAGPVLATPASTAGGPAAPRIAALSVDRSPLAGGVEVVVDGANFTPDVEVSLGEAVVGTVELESSARLRFTVPPMRYAGGRTLSIRTAAGVAQTRFHVLAQPLEELSYGYITSVGGGVPYLGDGGPATAPGVGLGPTGLAVDADGNVFVSDGLNHRVRRIDALTREITTYAGTGTPGFSGDGGPAITAELNNPQGLTFDTDGALLIADWLNFRVRRVDPVTRRIETINLGAFLNPVDLAVASDGSLFVSSYYFTDFEDGQLVRIHRPSGETEILYGGVPIYFGRIGIASDEQGRVLMSLGESAQIARYDVGTSATEVLVDFSESLSGPMDILPDGPGHCLVASSYEPVVNRFAFATGEVTRVAGTGEYGTSGDGGPAVDATFDYPVAIAFAADGSLLIADWFGTRVRRVDGAGIIGTLAGSGRIVPDETSGPATSASLAAEFVAADVDGNVFLSQRHRVLRIDAVNGELSLVAGTGEEGFGGDGGPATEALLSRPAGLAVDADGNVYVADSGNRRVRRIDAATGNILTVAGGVSRSAAPADVPFALFDPRGLALNGRKLLYIVDGTTPARVMKLDVRNGRLKVAATIPGQGYYARHIAIGPSGQVAVSGYGEIWRVDPGTGAVKVIAGIEDYPGSSGDGGPARDARVSAYGLVYTERGNLVVSNVYSQIPPLDMLSSALRVILKRRKTIHFYAGDRWGSGEYFGDGGPVTEARFSPSGLAADGDGNLYIADAGNGRIRVVRGVLNEL